MCGIIGYVAGKKPVDVNIVNQLLKFSETRGKEASGIAVITKNADNYIYKQPVSASVLIKHELFRDIFDKNEIVAVIGHARLQTNGASELNDNNQPVLADNIIGVHNGIITNCEEIKSKYNIKTETELDSYVLFKLFKELLNKNNIEKSVDLLFNEIQGSASCLLFVPDSNQLVGFTNTGSLYYTVDDLSGMVLFASESIILEKIIANENLNLKIVQVDLKKAVSFSIDSNKNINKNILLKNNQYSVNIETLSHSRLNDDWANIYQRALKKSLTLKRCNKCILPETMPFIMFDENGICNYCHSYKKRKFLGTDAFVEKISTLNSLQKNKKCIVPFSGGRDSSYALYILSELGVKMVAYSYDWGMLTDLGRRNQARVVGKLGVEHVVVSANIERKRKNIKNNVLAWMKNPEPGMIPLFMAGDKQYYYYAKKIAKDFNSSLIIYGHNPLEETFFKVGFSGVNPVMKAGSYFKLNNYKTLNLLWFYFVKMIKNPLYINSSLVDSLGAYLSYYGSEHNNIDLYDYIEWEETKVNSVLENVFNWEKSSDTNSTWRIGDGTAPLYNYLYMFFAGFNEFDTFRSNQIRNGSITRDYALSQLQNDHVPRFESIQWYFDIIKLDPNRFIESIKKYEKDV
jgi:glucosamine--fructose-6-phosphate aminotransferase (isomerizing)